MSAAALRAHHERSTGQGSPSKIIEQPVGKICHFFAKNRGTSNSLFSELIFLPSIKSLGHSPDRKKKWGVRKSCVWVVAHRNTIFVYYYMHIDILILLMLIKFNFNII